MSDPNGGKSGRRSGSQLNPELQQLLVGLLDGTGMQQQTLAEHLGWNESKVSRELKKIRLRGDYRTLIRLPASCDSKKLLDDLVLSSRALGNRERYVANGGTADPTTKFGAVVLVAALRLIAYLDRDPGATRYVGVSWGGHVRQVIESIGMLLGYGTADHRRYENVVVFNVAGDMFSSLSNPFDFHVGPHLNSSPLRYPPTVLARRLADVLGTRPNNIVLFPGAGWIPLVSTRDGNKPKKLAQARQSRREAERYLAEFDGYRRIFLKDGRSAAYKLRAHVILTGVGDKLSYQALMDATGQSEHPAVKEVADTAVGDLSGIPLGDDGFVSNTPGGKLLNEATIGFSSDDWTNLMRDAELSDSDRLGVLAVTSGRPVSAAAAWKAGVNVLCVDEFPTDNATTAKP